MAAQCFELRDDLNNSARLTRLNGSPMAKYSTCWCKFVNQKTIVRSFCSFTHLSIRISVFRFTSFSLCLSLSVYPSNNSLLQYYMSSCLLYMSLAFSLYSHLSTHAHLVIFQTYPSTYRPVAGPVGVYHVVLFCARIDPSICFSLVIFVFLLSFAFRIRLRVRALVCDDVRAALNHLLLLAIYLSINRSIDRSSLLGDVLCGWRAELLGSLTFSVRVEFRV